jgi:protein-S-isoprenylcysteine O-methyltransferase Ste14
LKSGVLTGRPQAFSVRRMSLLRRAINLILALTLILLGAVGSAYFYFIDPSWPRWIVVATIIVGAAGLYWLWDEHVNLGEHPKD